MGSPVLPAPLNWAAKIFGACGTNQFLHVGLYDCWDLSNILAPRGGGGRVLGTGTAPGRLPCMGMLVIWDHSFPTGHKTLLCNSSKRGSAVNRLWSGCQNFSQHPHNQVWEENWFVGGGMTWKPIPPPFPPRLLGRRVGTNSKGRGTRVRQSATGVPGGISRYPNIHTSK